MHIIEHRRVQGGDWIKVQTVDDDILDFSQTIVNAANEESGANDWRIRTLSDAPKRTEPPAGTEPDKPSWWDRFRFWWTLKTSPRGKA